MRSPEDEAYWDLVHDHDVAKARIAELEAEITRRDAEANRPIEVGDEVLYRWGKGNDYTVGIVVEMDDPKHGHMASFENSSGIYEGDVFTFRRIGRAKSMPNGTLAPKIGA